MDQSKQSGAYKRKLKRQKEEKIKKLPKLTDFGFVGSTNLQEKSQENNNISDNTNTTDTNTFDIDVSIDQNELTKNVQTQARPQLPSTSFSAPDDIGTESLSDFQSYLNKEAVQEFKSDIGHFINCQLTEQQKRFILNCEPCRPSGPFPKDSKQENRSFSTYFYTEQGKFGEISRGWLRYSVIIDAAYCEPCWLFSISNERSEWRTGVRTWKSLSWKIKKHSNTKHHIASCKIYELWKKNKTVDRELEDKIQYEASFWKMVLDRLFNITLTLAKNSLAFRGHRESTNLLDEDSYNGNFLSQVQLLAKYDDFMKQLLNMPQG